jgi:hypothetical protein
VCTYQQKRRKKRGRESRWTRPKKERRVEEFQGQSTEKKTRKIISSVKKEEKSNVYFFCV